MKSARHIPKLCSLRGFTLVELLTVLLIIGIVAGFVVPAVNGLGRSGALTNGGNMVVNLATYARQEAMSKNTMTALVLLGGQGTDEDFRALTVIEYTPIIGWSQITAWEPLPSGVIVDFTDAVNSSFMSNSPEPFPFLENGGGQTNPPVKYQGQQVADQTGYAARIFLPTGALQNPAQPAQLRLVDGYLQGNQVVYTHHDQTRKPTNYYDVTIVGLSGIVKVDRP